MKVEIVPPTSDHIQILAERMRFADRREIFASHCYSPSDALQRALVSSRLVFTGLVNGDVVCMFGVAQAGMMSPSIGIPWMLGTDLVEQFPRTFLKRCRKYVCMMLEAYPILKNHVDARNERSIEWLKWLGFTMHPAEPFGPFRLPFLPFEMQRGKANTTTEKGE